MSSDCKVEAEKAIELIDCMKDNICTIAKDGVLPFFEA
jgi:hypothetical protein